MESFVPFGGFFSASVDFKGGPLVGGSYQCLPRCHLCNEKCEQEVSAITKGGGCTVSVAEHYQSSLPPWLLHMTTELSTNKGLNAIKVPVYVYFSKPNLDSFVGTQELYDPIC